MVLLLWEEVTPWQRCVTHVVQLQMQILGWLWSLVAEHAQWPLRPITSWHLTSLTFMWPASPPLDDQPLSAAVLKVQKSSSHIKTSCRAYPSVLKPWPSRRWTWTSECVPCCLSAGHWLGILWALRGERVGPQFQPECSIGLGAGEFSDQVGALGYLSCSPDHSWMNRAMAGGVWQHHGGTRNVL